MLQRPPDAREEISTGGAHTLSKTHSSESCRRWRWRRGGVGLCCVRCLQEIFGGRRPRRDKTSSACVAVGTRCNYNTGRQTVAVSVKRGEITRLCGEWVVVLRGRGAGLMGGCRIFYFSIALFWSGGMVNG